jgi:hypothetical protein
VPHRCDVDRAAAYHSRKLHLDLLRLGPDSAAAQLLEWLAAADPAVLNVAGPRSSEDAAIYAAVAALLRSVLPND